MTKNWSNGPGRNLKKLSFLIRFQYVFNTFFIQGSPGRRLSPPNFVQNSVKNMRLSAFLHHDRPKTMYCQHFCTKNIQKHCTVAIFATGPSKTDVLSAFFAPGPSKNDVLSACLRQDRPKTLYCRHFCTRTVQKRCTVSFFWPAAYKNVVLSAFLHQDPSQSVVLSAFSNRKHSKNQ